MKKIILIVGLCVASLVVVHAQQNNASKAPLTFDQRVDKILTQLTSACTLTPEQVKKARPIVEETVKARLANKQQYSSDHDKLRAANIATMKAENTKMNAILDAGQQKKLAAFEAQKVQPKKTTAPGNE